MKENVLDNLTLDGNLGAMSMEELKESFFSIVSPKVRAYILSAFMLSVSGLNASAIESKFDKEFNVQHTGLLQGLKLESISFSEVKQKMLSRLDELACLENVVDAKPVAPEVAAIARRVIELTDDKALLMWILFPDTNGALSMELKQNTGMTGNVSIGVDGYSCFVQSQDKFDMREDSQVSAEEVAEFLNKVSNLA